MKCSQCQGPLRVTRTRLNGKPVYGAAVTEERLTTLENVAKAAQDVVNMVNDLKGPNILSETMQALTEALERLENADTVTVGGNTDESS